MHLQVSTESESSRNYNISTKLSCPHRDQSSKPTSENANQLTSPSLRLDLRLDATFGVDNHLLDLFAGLDRIRLT